MSLHSMPFTAVPEETARVARAAFPQGNLYMRMRDEIGVIYEDEAFAALFSHRGQPAEAPWRLALVTILQLRADSAEGRRPSTGPEKRSAPRAGQRLRGEKSPAAGGRKRGV
jgi:hypothetical protein